MKTLKKDFSQQSCSLSERNFHEKELQMKTLKKDFSQQGCSFSERNFQGALLLEKEI